MGRIFRNQFPKCISLREHLREQFIIWGSNLENKFWRSNFKKVFFKEAISKMYFFKTVILKVKFLRESNF